MTFNRTRTRRPANMLGAGLIIGAGVGAALDNIGLGIGVGLAIGAALSKKQKQKNESHDDQAPTGTNDSTPQ